MLPQDDNGDDNNGGGCGSVEDGWGGISSGGRADGQVNESALLLYLFSAQEENHKVLQCAEEELNIKPLSDTPFSCAMQAEMQKYKRSDCGDGSDSKRPLVKWLFDRQGSNDWAKNRSAVFSCLLHLRKERMVASLCTASHCASSRQLFQLVGVGALIYSRVQRSCTPKLSHSVLVWHHTSFDFSQCLIQQGGLTIGKCRLRRLNRL